ncbi:MAG: hypothetical protein A2259_03580 [Candidatus Moranbacteria bacterium RIFOXYA2_FULL_43_15]|nr:MAG: hypothetical protein A2259_03580 [Candidatus Moranbacteria bacterium RIFOXYA2_FULL_43_15]
MFDLTKNVKLNQEDIALYRRTQTGLYVLAFSAGLILLFLILFSSKKFVFSFLTPDSNKNDIIDPRDENNIFPDRGEIKTGNPLIFDTVATGRYSSAEIRLTVAKNSPKPENVSAKVRKSYQAFLYPEGDPIGFKDGTLLKNNGGYFIVSDGKIRKFANENTVLDLGFPRNAFRETSPEESGYNPEGEIIIQSKIDSSELIAPDYPDSSIFKIEETYYILKNGELTPFISEKAYLTQYDINQAIVKGRDFLRYYPISNNPLGFGDGTIISYGEAAFIVSGESILPIDNPETFVEKGYLWEEIIPVSGDEFSLYPKGKLQMLRSPHPDGIVYLTEESSKWYLVKEGKKHLLSSENIARSWLKKSPVTVSEKSLELKDACSFEKETLSFRTYSCRFPVDSLEVFRGKDYEFKLLGKSDTRLETLNVTFKKEVSRDNLKFALIDLYNKLRMNYAR